MSRIGCKDLDSQWPGVDGKPRGPRLCVSYPRCECGREDNQVSRVPCSCGHVPMSATVVYAYDAFRVLANPVSKEVSLRVIHRSPVREMTPDQARTLARVLVEAAELAEGPASVSK